MDEPESLFNEQSTVTSPALGTNFMKVIQLAMSGSQSEVQDQAWDVLCGAGVRDETQPIVNVLGEAQVNIQAFLVNFLKRIWIKYLGDNTSVLGAYESSRLTEEAEKKTPPRLIHTLLNSGRYGRPELKPEGAVQANWPHVFRPPQVPKWSEIAIPNHPDERLSQALATLVADMKRQSKGMDWVIAHAIALSPDGLTGIGRSAEARAYTFCYLSRIYRPSSGVLQFTPSPQVLQLQDDLRAPNAGYITLNVLVAQMLPILENMTPETFKGRAEHIDVSVGSADDCPFAQWDALSPLPLWLFAIHLKFRMSDDFFAWSLARDWAKDGSDSFVVLRRMEGQEPRRIPVLSLVAWILLGRLPERIEDGNPQKRRIGEDVHRPELECILQVRLADVDTLLLDNPNFLGDSWRGARPAFIKTFLDIVIEGNPSKCQQCAKGVMRLVIELLNATGAERYDTGVTTIAKLFLRFTALCGTYTQAFVEAMTEANRTTAFVIFSHMLKLLNPLPGTNESADLAKLQKTYEQAAYEDPKDLPPHLTDRFVGVVLEIARHQTPVAQGLADAGILQLLDAIRGGRYTYPEVPDPVPPGVRRMLRERMCEDTLKALSERVYLAAQLKRVYKAAEAPDDDDDAPRTPPPRIRRRPSWMATGG